MTRAMNHAMHGCTAPLAGPLERDACSRGWIFTGTRDQLIAAGLVQPGAFPGDHGQRKTMCRNPVARAGEWRTIHALSKRRFSVTIVFTPEEKVVYDIKEQSERAAAEEARSSAVWKNYKIEQQVKWVSRVATPEGRDNTKASMLGNFRLAAEMLTNAHRSPSLPYRFDPDVIDDIDWHLREIERLYASAEMRVRPGALADADVGFQGMIQGLMSATAPTDPGAPRGI